MKNQRELSKKWQAEIKEEIRLLREKDKETSDRIDKEETLKEKEQMVEIEIPQASSTIHKYKASDLPLYFKWEGVTLKWCYRVYQVEGKIKVDQIKVQDYDGFKAGTSPVNVEYHESTITSAFDKSNQVADKKYWDGLLQDVINHLQDV